MSTLPCLQFCILLHLVASQDVFLAQRDDATQSSLASDLSASATVGHDWWVFSIAFSQAPTLCWDVNQGTSPPTLWAWECNGHETQLFFFDAGTYNIKWAGVPSGQQEQCVDAGDQTKGTQLFLWDCNGMPQQQYGYDDVESTIYLLNSDDATSCVDLLGGNTASGTSLQVWDCMDTLMGQQFWLRSGITIRVGANYQKCLDLAGGSAFDGAAIELWDCNGSNNQQWIFDNWVILWAGDWNYCIDAGSETAGNTLMLWSCNGMDQQKWGYDGNEQTVFLSSTGQCMDIPGGSLDNGNQVEIWDCNLCWNQQWLVSGPVDAALGMTLHSTANLTGSCPPDPSGGGGGGSMILPDCSIAASGWPVFNDASSLSSDSTWSSYFNKVYGEIPQTGYPICIGSLFMIAKSGGSVGHSATQCHDKSASEGALVDEMSACCDPKDSSKNRLATFIYNSKNFGRSVPSNYWAEIMHMHFGQDGDATWYYLAIGSAVWWNVGNTKIYDDHPAAVKDMLGTSCHDQGHTKTPATECENDFSKLYQKGQSNGLDSIQFTHHYDCGCGVSGTSSWTHTRLCQTEIIDIKNYVNSGGCGSPVYKAGWMASQSCTCDSSYNYANCKGFGIGHR